MVICFEFLDKVIKANDCKCLYIGCCILFCIIIAVLVITSIILICRYKSKKMEAEFNYLREMHRVGKENGSSISFITINKTYHLKECDIIYIEEDKNKHSIVYQLGLKGPIEIDVNLEKIKSIISIQLGNRCNFVFLDNYIINTSYVYYFDEINKEIGLLMQNGMGKKNLSGNISDSDCQIIKEALYL